jgi:hypothetical protein
MTVLERLATLMLKDAKRTKASLSDSPLECSELTLVTNDSGEYLIAFHVLGQDFQLMKQGVFTFNELGEAFSLEPNFESAVMSFLEWRATSLEAFSI